MEVAEGTLVSGVNVGGQDVRPNICELGEGEVEGSIAGEGQVRRSEDVFVMDLAKWNTLPKELIRLVCAHLPLPLLLSLRCSAVEGKWSINFDDPEFRRLCAEKHTNMSGMVMLAMDYIYYIVGVYDVKSFSKQKPLWLDTEQAFSGVSSSDGGLVCFALAIKYPERSDSVVMFVVNPLTGDCRELPPHGVRPVHLKMMQLVMNQKERSYRVLLVGRYNKNASVTRTRAFLFDSSTGVWSKVSKKSSERFIGIQYHFDRGVLTGTGPCAYDCATGQLIDPKDHNPKSTLHDRHVLVEDHLYVLEEKGKETRHGLMLSFCISEHEVQVQKDRVSFSKLRDHHCDQFHILFSSKDRYHLHLRHACKGFLLVTGKLCLGNHQGRKPDIAWLYNLSTGYWVDLEEQAGPLLFRPPLLLCELRWDAVP
ncbi:hypothetical protein KC19_5G086700 [Ceratodon purpureus]|uniref:F-box domain-containing protein n=1 Tax=Ceratodon purpureus TaxID=3225 RepID=A0A8T0HZD1_CERPU|nr:hypothetical protein KC19_5G086700 [Ceratodon purpureus]